MPSTCSSSALGFFASCCYATTENQFKSLCPFTEVGDIFIEQQRTSFFDVVQYHAASQCCLFATFFSNFKWGHIYYFLLLLFVWSSFMVVFSMIDGRGALWSLKPSPLFMINVLRLLWSTLSCVWFVWKVVIWIKFDSFILFININIKISYAILLHSRKNIRSTFLCGSYLICVDCSTNNNWSSKINWSSICCLTLWDWLIDWLIDNVR